MNIQVTEKDINDLGTVLVAFKDANFNHTGADVISLYAAIDGVNGLRNRIMDCQKGGLKTAKKKRKRPTEKKKEEVVKE
jgi:hypothetical protein